MSKTTTHGAFIVDSLGKILIVHPTNAPHKMWSIPKGHSKKNEKSIRSALRETKEETNVDITTFPYRYKDLGKQKYKSKQKTLHGHLFEFEFPLSEVPLNLCCPSLITGTTMPECDIVKWVNLEEAITLLHESQVRLFTKNIKNK